MVNRFFGFTLENSLGGDYLVIVFCMISGYFAAGKSITSAKGFFNASIKRYIRLALPAVRVAIFVLLIQRLLGFGSQAVGTELNNACLLEMYPQKIGILQAIIYALILSPRIASPLWMLKSILLGILLIYGIKYALKKPIGRVFASHCLL